MRKNEDRVVAAGLIAFFALIFFGLRMSVAVFAVVYMWLVFMGWVGKVSGRLPYTHGREYW